MFKKFLVSFLILVMAAPLYAHSGRLDGSGGHRVNKTWIYHGRYLRVVDKVKYLGAGSIKFEPGDYHYHAKPEANGFKDGIYLPAKNIDKTRTDTIYVSDENRVGSKESDKYHKPNCRYIKNIKEENAVIFEDPEDAEKSEYEPCKRCKAGVIE